MKQTPLSASLFLHRFEKNSNFAHRLVSKKRLQPHTMNKQEQDIFLDILSSALWEREPNLSLLSGTWSWHSIVAAFDEHALLRVVANTILSLPAHYLPDAQLQQYMMMKVANMIRTHLLHNSAIATVFAEFEAAGCSPVLLKGQGLATLYPKGCVRSSGDVDVYVDPARYDVAKQIIYTHADKEEVEHAIENEYVRHLKITTTDGVIFEVHRHAGEAANIIYNNVYLRMGAKCLLPENTATVSLQLPGGNNTVVRVPDVKCNVWHNMNHLVLHFAGDGIGLRQFCDWMLVLRQFTQQATDEDYQQLRQTLKRIGMLRAWQILGGILVHQLQFPAKDYPFYSEQMALKSQGLVLQEVLSGGNFHFHSHDNSLQSLPHGLRRIILVALRMHSSSKPMAVISDFYPYVHICRCWMTGIRCYWERLVDKLLHKRK